MAQIKNIYTWYLGLGVRGSGFLLHWKQVVYIFFTSIKKTLWIEMGSRYFLPSTGIFNLTQYFEK
uniref:Uncharacterized protein n=1 Tax=Octopus bimaculoides TaxID=37653 RepID=A0A0L8IBM0_OCTBM